MSNLDRNFIEALGHTAVRALLDQQSIRVTQREGEPRNGFPLPIKRNKSENPDGTVTQEYRPLAILEWINEVCSGELVSRLAKQRAEDKKNKATKP